MNMAEDEERNDKCKKNDLCEPSDIIIYCSFLLIEKNQKIKTVRKNQKIQRFAPLPAKAG